MWKSRYLFNRQRMSDGFPYCSFPESLMVQTTSRCNAACVFCPYPAVSGELRHGEMSFTLFAKLMRECGRHVELRSINLFLMNEPLMDPRIVDRCNFAKEHNPDAAVCLWTNGCNLDDRLSPRLHRHQHPRHVATDLPSAHRPA